MTDFTNQPKIDPLALMRHTAQDAVLFHDTMAALQKLSPKSLFDATYDDLKDEKGKAAVRAGMNPNATQDEKVTAIVTLCALVFMSRVTAYQDLLAAAQKRKEVSGS